MYLIHGIYTCWRGRTIGGRLIRSLLQMRMQEQLTGLFQVLDATPLRLSLCCQTPASPRLAWGRIASAKILR
jgi:hypothetical protein